MNDSLFRFVIAPRISILIVLCLGVSLSAAPPEVVPAPSPADRTDQLGEYLKRDRKNSLTLIRQQSVSQCADLARDAIDRQDYQTALPLIERLFADPNSFVATNIATEVDSHEEARRLLRMLPRDQHRRFEESRSGLVRRIWERARDRGLSEVSAFLDQFADSPLGVEAYWWAACHERDHMRFQLASAAFSRVVDHPYATDQQRSMALIASSQMRPDSNRESDSTEFRDRIDRTAPNLVVRIGGNSRTVSEWLSDTLNATNPSVESGLPADLMSERLTRPALLSTWTQPLTNALEISPSPREQKQRDQGVVAVPLQQPIVIDDRNLVVVRTLEEIRAFDLDSGKSRWAVPNTEYSHLPKQFLNNASFQSLAIDWSQRRLFADSIFGRMTTNGRQVLAIQEPDRNGEFGITPNSAGGLLRVGPRFNQLCSYSLETGNPTWQIGGLVAGPTNPLGGHVFLGPPLVVDDLLFVVAQRDTELAVLAINAETGTLVWSIKLGTVSLPITEDLLRSRTACSIIWHDGQLICSTVAGTIIAIDPLVGQVKWGYQYPATTISATDLTQGPNLHVSPQTNEPWWDAWREPFLKACRPSQIEQARLKNSPPSNSSDPTILVFASPDMDELHAMRLSSGQSIWRVARNGGLFVAGVIENRVLVVEGNSLRAHDLLTGNSLWRTPISEPDGHGTIVGSVYLSANQAGGMTSVDLQTGRVLPESSSYAASLGTLVATRTGWIACNRQTLMQLPRLDDIRKQTNEQLKADSSNETLRIRAAFLDLQAGDTASARERLEGLKSSSARKLLRRVFIQALLESDPKHSHEIRTEFAKQLNELSENANDRFAAAEAISASAVAASDYVAAVDAALDGLNGIDGLDSIVDRAEPGHSATVVEINQLDDPVTSLDQSQGLVKTDLVNVRRDRRLLGLIDEACRKADQAAKAAIDELFTNRVQKARKSRDRSAVQQLALQWRGLDWGRKLTLMDEERVLRKRSLVKAELPLLEAELLLLDAAGSNDRRLASLALERLAQRFDRSPANSRDAVAIRQRILREWSFDSRSGGPKSAEDEIKMAQLRGSIIGKLKPEWPEFDPKFEIRDDRTFEGYALVPLQAEPGSLSARLDVLVDRMGKEVTFRGDAFSRLGQDEDREQKIKLPPRSSPYRGSTGYMLREAWGIGRVIILLVGTELFGISPLDEHGEPNPQFLWSNPIDLHSTVSDTRIISVTGANDEIPPIVVDQLNRPIGKVGPVRASYFCYQKGTKLIAAETDSGRTLWELSDFPADVTVLGDDHFVYVWRDAKEIAILSAIDGRLIEVRPETASAKQILHQIGSLVWTTTREKEVRIELNDLSLGKSIWTRSDPRNSLWVVLDIETLGLVTPDGRLSLINARVGTAIGEPLSIPIDQPTGITAWQDSDRWYLALDSGSGNFGELKKLQLNNAYRLLFLSGTLIAVDKRQAQIVWQRELKNEPLPIDQSNVAPVFVQIWKLPPEGQTVTVKLIDKRTGKDAIPELTGDFSANFLLNPDPQQGILEMKLARKTIRLTYSNE